MPALPNPAILTANGSYDIKLRAGALYLFALKGNFDGATVTMTTVSTVDPTNATFDSVEGGTWTAETEQTLDAPSHTTRLTVTDAGGSTSIRVMCINRQS